MVRQGKKPFEEERVFVQIKERVECLANKTGGRGKLDCCSWGLAEKLLGKITAASGRRKYRR